MCSSVNNQAFSLSSSSSSYYSFYHPHSFIPVSSFFLSLQVPVILSYFLHPLPFPSFYISLPSSFVSLSIILFPSFPLLRSPPSFPSPASQPASHSLTTSHIAGLTMASVPEDRLGFHISDKNIINLHFDSPSPFPCLSFSFRLLYSSFHHFSPYSDPLPVFVYSLSPSIFFLWYSFHISLLSLLSLSLSLYVSSASFIFTYSLPFLLSSLSQSYLPSSSQASLYLSPLLSLSLSLLHFPSPRHQG